MAFRLSEGHAPRYYECESQIDPVRKKFKELMLQ